MTIEQHPFGRVFTAAAGLAEAPVPEDWSAFDRERVYFASRSTQISRGDHLFVLAAGLGGVVLGLFEVLSAGTEPRPSPDDPDRWPFSVAVRAIAGVRRDDAVAVSGVRTPRAQPRHVGDPELQAALYAAVGDAEAPSSWSLLPGESIKRTNLHERFGGGGQGGIAPSAQTPNVLVFSDAESGRRHGYIDGWQDDGCFHYTGEGQAGDQELARGNRAIANHSADDRALRVFDGVAGTVEYVGEFVLDRRPYRADAPESQDSPSGGRVVRQVLVFPLRPVDTQPRPPDPALVAMAGGPQLLEVPVEQQNTERAVVSPSGERYEVERREQRLVLAYAAFLAERQVHVGRHRIRPAGEAKPLFSDVFDSQRNNLIEAKGSGSRSNVRMAIGQLADYGRFLTPTPAKAILLPERPRQDLEALLASQGIDAIWPTRDGFEDNADGRYT